MSLEISEANFIRVVSRNSVVCLDAGSPDMLFRKFPKHYKSQKTEEMRVTKCVSETSKTLFINGFMQNLFIEGHKMLLQKFPKQFLYCPRFLLKTVTKCASEISETLFIKVFPARRFLSKTVKKYCFGNFRNNFYK